MGRPAVEVADVLRGYAHQYLALYPGTLTQAKIIEDLISCRTASLGGHKQECLRCGHQLITYNSCRNRHCPKCQASKQADWMRKQADQLLQVPYFHLVFTLPQQLSPLALQNKGQLYGLLFQCASQSLLTIAGDPQHLGARIGFTAILHTWGQTLMHHPHLHCLVPAGGLSRCGHKWIAARNRFLVPVRPLSRLLRGNYLCRLQSAWDNHELLLAGRLQPLADPCRWKAFIEELYHIDWVVYAKPAFGSPQQVLKYLSRYTHRVGISNQRLLSLADGQVTFRYKDYRNGHRQHRMRLTAVEFIRRFLLHSLPKGFVRIRHYGLLANRSREKNLQICRTLLTQKSPPQAPPESVLPIPSSTTPDDNPCFRCPKCNHTISRLIVLPPVRDGPENPHFYHW